jgi:hypothetical protein
VEAARFRVVHRNTTVWTIGSGISLGVFYNRYDTCKYFP